MLAPVLALYKPLVLCVNRLETPKLQCASASLSLIKYRLSAESLHHSSPVERAALPRDRETVRIYGDAQVGIRAGTEARVAWTLRFLQA